MFSAILADKSKEVPETRMIGTNRGLNVEMLRRAFLSLRYRFFAPGFDGMMSPPKCRFLYRTVVQHVGRGTIVELGPYKGCSTSWLALAGIRSNKEHLWAIDTFTGTPSWRRVFDAFPGFQHRMKVNRFQRFVTPVRSSTTEAAKQWQRAIQILHIDADHEYAAVSADIRDWVLPFLEESGIVIFDDYDSCHPGVVKAVHELLIGGFRIVGLVEELAEGRGGGSVALKRIRSPSVPMEYSNPRSG